MPTTTWAKLNHTESSIEMSDNRAYCDCLAINGDKGYKENFDMLLETVPTLPPTPLHYPIMNNHTHFNSCMAIAAGDTCLTWT